MEVKCPCIINEPWCASTPKIPQITWLPQLKKLSNRIHLQLISYALSYVSRMPEVIIVRYATSYAQLKALTDIGLEFHQTAPVNHSLEDDCF